METLDTLQAVQRQWLYLESIFASQQNDSGKQMIGDRNKFQAVTNRLNYHMNRINDDKNVRKALTYDLFLNDLNDMA
jgi:dynein heavy chain